jgi:hypothetical protein
MKATLDGVKAKLGRAEAHLNELNLEIRSWLSTSARTRDGIAPNPEDKRKYVSAMLKATKPPDWISLIVGDVLYNLRSALDHLVCQLAIRNGREDRCRCTQFPIFKSTPKKMSDFRDYIRPAGQDAMTIIEGLQPYKRGDEETAAAEDLWVLSELNNIDKHRLIILTAVNVRFTQAHFIDRITGERQVLPVKNMPNFQRLEEGAELPHFTAIFENGKVPSSEVDVYLEAERTIVFHQTGLCCDGSPVDVTLRRLQSTVIRHVTDFESRFFS